MKNKIEINYFNEIIKESSSLYSNDFDGDFIMCEDWDMTSKPIVVPKVGKEENEPEESNQ